MKDYIFINHKFKKIHFMLYFLILCTYHLYKKYFLSVKFSEIQVHEIVETHFSSVLHLILPSVVSHFVGRQARDIVQAHIPPTLCLILPSVVSHFAER